MAADAGTDARERALTAIEARGIYVRFGAVEALRDVSFALPCGAFLAILGPNGAGKTTLLRVLLGLQPPARGTVHLFGEAPSVSLGERVGYIPQTKTLDRGFPASCMELVLTGVRCAWPWRVSQHERAAARAALAQAGIEHLSDRQVGKLSGGELQRAYLARCLVRKPQLLVLDEPGTGLDLAGEAAMHHLLEAYRRSTGATVAMITHDWEGARLHATHALLIDRGLAAFGPPDEVAGEARLLRVFGHTGHRHTHREGAA